MAYLWLGLIVFSFVAVGNVAVQILRTFTDLSKGAGSLEIALIAPIVGLMTVALISFFMATTGLYRLAWATVPLLGAAAAILLGWKLRPRRLGLWVFGPLAALAMLTALYWPVADVSRGGLDAGVYVNAAALLNRYGGIVAVDRGLASLDSNLYNEFFLKLHPDRYLLHHLRFAGFYVLDGAKGLVLPQLFHFYPAILGLTVSVAGTPTGLKLNALIGAMAVGAFFLAVRRLFDSRTALIAASMLAISTVQIWFSRYTTTEVTGQLLFYTAIWAVAAAHQSGARDAQAALGAIGGVALGEMLLLHPDFPFIFPVLLCYGVGLRLTRSWRPWHWWFFGTAAVFTLGLVVYIALYAYPYVGDLYYHVIKAGRNNLLLLLSLSALSLLAVLALDRTMPALMRRVSKGETVLKYILLGIGFALTALGVYGYVVRPGILQEALAGNWTQLWSYVGAPVEPGPDTTFVRFGWYLSPLGILVALVTFPGVVAQKPRWERWFWLGFFLVYSLIFLEETYAKSHYIYTMRRYVPIVFPGFVSLVAFAVTTLWRSRSPLIKPGVLRIASVILAATIYAFFVYTARPIIGHWEWGGFSGKLGQLASYFPDNAVILFSDGRDPPQAVATPLWSFYGLETYVLVRDQPDLDLIDRQVREWYQQGRPVFALLGTNGGKLYLPSFSIVPLGEWQLNVKEFEQLFDQKPLNVYSVPFDLGIYRLVPLERSDQSRELKMGNMEYEHLVRGFYDRESREGRIFRWTDGQAVIRFSGELRASRVRLLMSAGPAERPQDVEVRISLDGRPISTVRVARGEFRWYAVDLPEAQVAGGQGLPKVPQSHLIGISSPTFTMSSLGLSHDGRRLGVQVASLVLDP
jgi:hypothetical protein